MKALLMRQPGEVVVHDLPDVVAHNDDVLLKVRMVGLCGSDLNS
jgi:threonine dehydrogenase-like Zn-dependent dehydrogenase